ncbi:MAG: aspartate kinase [Bdellovibrionales bacterium]|nr:aspartate kinase [Bdellovibrionales bacterium]
MIVQKYGGVTLSNPEKILKIAENAAKLHQSGENLILVVSAMGKSTDELINLAYQISPHPSRRELDMLLTAGERIAMSLMSMALTRFGRPAISFTGSQAGVFTSSDHSNAHIFDMKPIRVEKEIQDGKIVVLAGFQGVDPKSKEITTLGRGGSDTTAVAMAAHFKAKRCEILKDVPGVFSADPKLVSNAKLYDQLGYEHLTEMCWWGATVLHSRSVD